VKERKLESVLAHPDELIVMPREEVVYIVRSGEEQTHRRDSKYLDSVDIFLLETLLDYVEHPTLRP